MEPSILEITNKATVTTPNVINIAIHTFELYGYIKFKYFGRIDGLDVTIPKKSTSSQSRHV